jgi:hypothetical protein
MTDPDIIRREFAKRDGRIDAIEAGRRPPMTLREYFAGQALVGLLANSHLSKNAVELEMSAPTISVVAADALIAKLERTKP